MHCPHCGNNIDDGSKFCVACGFAISKEQGNNATQPVPNVQYVYHHNAPIYMVSNYLALSIINTILWTITCNIVALILSIIAIVKSCSVDKILLAGNYQGAVNAAKAAKTLNIFALLIGFLVPIIIIILFFAIPSLSILTAIMQEI